MPTVPPPDDAPLAAVFVYGTLRPGRRNWPVAAPWSTAHEPATLTGFGLFALAYPVVAPLDPPGSGSGVRGDLLRLDPLTAEAALARFDEFEGVDHLRPERSYYERTATEVTTDDGTRHGAWLYVPGAALRAEVRPQHRVPGDEWLP